LELVRVRYQARSAWHAKLRNYHSNNITYLDSLLDLHLMGSISHGS